MRGQHAQAAPRLLVAGIEADDAQHVGRRQKSELVHQAFEQRGRRRHVLGDELIADLGMGRCLLGDKARDLRHLLAQHDDFAVERGDDGASLVAAVLAVAPAHQAAVDQERQNEQQETAQDRQAFLPFAQGLVRVDAHSAAWMTPAGAPSRCSL